MGLQERGLGWSEACRRPIYVCEKNVKFFGEPYEAVRLADILTRSVRPRMVVM